MIYDIAIIGGGPAGCSAAIMLHQYGYKVAIFEKDSFPKHNIGESFLPIVNSDYMKVIGLDESIKNMCFQKKYGNTFIWGNNRKPWNLFFDKRLNADQQTFSEKDTQSILEGNYIHSYQVNRYDFDMLFVKKVKELGIDFHENSKIGNITFENKEIQELQLDNGDKIRANFYVDASGQMAKISNLLGERTYNTDLGFSATYGYFKNCKFIDNFISKHTQYIVSTDIGWIWFIYIGNNITSVGIVTDQKNITKEIFLNTLYKTKEINTLIDGAELVDSLGNKTDKIKKARNRSYNNQSLYGKNYLLVGDAAGFVDPILSGGLSLALMSGITSTAYIDHYLKNNNINILQEYEEIIFKDINNYYQLAQYWYGNNKSTESWFWKAKNILGYDISNIYNKRAFAYVASGKVYTNKNFEIFNELRIKNFAYNFEDIDEINHMFSINNSSENILKTYKKLYSNNNDEYLKSVHFLWKQAKIIEKEICKIDNNLSELLSYTFQNLTKIQVFDFIFSDKIFLDLSAIISGENTKINYYINELIFLLILKWNNKDIILNDFELYFSLDSNFILYNGIKVILNIDLIPDNKNYFIIKNNKIFINNYELSSNDIIVNIDKFI